MSKHDLNELTAQYPVIIQQMPQLFTAHDFILKLAQKNQRLYVEALYAYKDGPSGDAETPFLTVHRRLAKMLSDFPNLVEYQRTVKSKDIFHNDSECSEWRKV